MDGAFGNRNSVAETLARAIPLALAGIGVSIAFQAGVFNVGAEGQLFLGATAAIWVGLQLADWPVLPLITVMMLSSMLVGGLWAAIAAFLKVRFQASELINTIMMNYNDVHFVVAYHLGLSASGSSAKRPWLPAMLVMARLQAVACIRLFME